MTALREEKLQKVGIETVAVWFRQQPWSWRKSPNALEWIGYKGEGGGGFGRIPSLQTGLI